MRSSRCRTRSTVSGVRVAEEKRMSPGSRWAIGVMLVAGLIVAGSVAWAVTGWGARGDAQRDLARAKTALESTGHDAESSNARLTTARATVARVSAHADVIARAHTITELDQHELGFMQGALSAGLVGDVATYDRDVDARNALDSAHDATVEALRS